VLDFAPVYVESITQSDDKTDMTVRFLPRNAGLLGGQASLIE
jgi:hypothetical protein